MSPAEARSSSDHRSRLCSSSRACWVSSSSMISVPCVSTSAAGSLVIFTVPVSNTSPTGAAATGSTYVNLNRVSEGHDACQEVGVRWIEPVLVGANPVIVHPNALGERRMAEQTIAVLGLR